MAPPPSSLGFELPDLVDAAIVRALDPDREKRWPDVQSFTRELVGAMDETTHDFPLSMRETIVVPASRRRRREDRPQRREHADHREDVGHSGRPRMPRPAALSRPPPREPAEGGGVVAETVDGQAGPLARGSGGAADG